MPELSKEAIEAKLAEELFPGRNAGERLFRSYGEWALVMWHALVSKEQLRLKAEQELEAERRPIPVSERMPTGGRRWYLVSDGKRWDVALLLKGKSFMGHVLQFSAVTHWMEQPTLPAPFSSGEKEKLK